MLWFFVSHIAIRKTASPYANAIAFQGETL